MGLRTKQKFRTHFCEKEETSFLLRASTFTTDSFYCTTLNMKRSILKRKKDLGKKKKKKKTMDPSSNNHFTSRRQEVYSVQH